MNTPKRPDPSLPAKASPPKDQGGMALLAAMITVMVVAMLASSALWIQSSHFEIESALRQRQQAQWLLTGALDWSRVILREDARSSSTDTLVEPWAVPLQEAKLSSFLRAQPNASGSTLSENAQDESLADQVYLSGQITDLQSKLNVYNLLLAANSSGNLGPVNASTVSLSNNGNNGNNNGNSPQGAMLSWIRLFDVLHLPSGELEALNAQLKTLAKSTLSGLPNTMPGSGSNSANSLTPQRFEQLSWLGLSESTIRRLQPHATWLPFATAVNLNTASAEVLYASLPGLDLSDAQRLVRARENKPWQNMDQFKSILSAQNKSLALNEANYQLSSRFFEVRGQLRMGNTTITEKSVLLRDNANVQIIWRDKGAALRMNSPSTL